MRNLTQEKTVEAVLQQTEADDKRLQKIVESLVAHLHAFIRDVELTQDELYFATDFLNQVGKMTDGSRDEFILLSDVLGVTILVDSINHATSHHEHPDAHGEPGGDGKAAAGVTESSVLGPFYRKGAPELDPPANLARHVDEGDPLIVHGEVCNDAGEPLENALLDVWQTAPNRLYDVQDPDQPEMNLRAKVRTDANGRFAFQTVRPVPYTIPHDGPVGRFLEATGRHPWRPAHIHVIASADAYQSVITELFFEGDAYLDSDAVFGVKDSLVVNPVTHTAMSDAPDAARDFGVAPPFETVRYDFVLTHDGTGSDASAEPDVYAPGA